jgi:hypothetical protein
MLGFVKMCGVSAALSFTLVTGYGHLTDAGAPIGSTKLYHQRLSDAPTAPLAAADGVTLPVSAASLKGDRLATSKPAGCASPCTFAAGDGNSRGHVRYVTVESREGVNVSVLQRLPQTSVASR